MMNHDEDEEQETLFKWAATFAARYPELELLHAIPNGGKRNEREGARLKRQGVKAGVSDIHLPVPRGGYASLYIELKAVTAKNKKGSDKQREWIKKVKLYGNWAQICVGWYEASQVIEKYIKGCLKNET